MLDLGLLDWPTIRFGFTELLLLRRELEDVATRKLQDDPAAPAGVAALCMCAHDAADDVLRQLDALATSTTLPEPSHLLARWRLADLLFIATDLNPGDRYEKPGERRHAIVEHYHRFNRDLPCASVPHPDHLEDQDTFMRCLTADIFLLAAQQDVTRQVHAYLYRHAVDLKYQRVTPNT